MPKLTAQRGLPMKGEFDMEKYELAICSELNPKFDEIIRTCLKKVNGGIMPLADEQKRRLKIVTYTLAEDPKTYVKWDDKTICWRMPGKCSCVVTKLIPGVVEEPGGKRRKVLIPQQALKVAMEYGVEV